MNEAWAAIIAAIAAGLFGIGGAFVGLIVGRRQTTDQAHVEHGHWLREQRLQAYLNLVDTWDAVIKNLQAFQDNWWREVEAHQEHGGDVHLSVIAGRETGEAWATLRPATERVELLGPGKAVEAMYGILDAWRELSHVLDDQASAEPYATLEDRWYEAYGKGHVARANFHVAASTVVQTPPSPEGEFRL
ncbi:hypothetical protein [Streptomyces pseudovenezuelae]|uniref:hypothetical protein n=1 Tax=Streptomyces pseudovenezuelae TaxID=67350 RepID=UPI002E80EBA9|nr:hypothetical protein [Streptomyces pseudovenezuelae]WUA85802.1 hypothetical protein OHO81_00085 [Streptomyces pseudovenezuelae]WUA93963.1 hypothetical protein OHO81_44525 [Streptomyces pseudovenezuelae]